MWIIILCIIVVVIIAIASANKKRNSYNENRSDNDVPVVHINRNVSTQCTNINTCNNVELAEQLFSTLELGGKIDPKYQSKINSILSQCKSREEILMKVVDLCGDPTTLKRLYIISKAYVWAGAKYRNQAIKYLEMYIEKGGLDNANRIGKSLIYLDLGKAYEGEYKFDMALACYKKAISHNYGTPELCFIAKLYTKMNMLDKGIELLSNAQKRKIYSSDESFREVVDRELEDLKSKKARGYVYKPRKKQAASTEK